MELRTDFERLLADTLASRDRSPRTQETWMLRLFARFVNKPLDQVEVEDIQEYQRHLTKERKVGFSTFNRALCMRPDQAASFRTPSTNGTPRMTSAIS